MGLAADVTLRSGFWFIWESDDPELDSIEKLQEALDRGEAVAGRRLLLKRLTYDPAFLGLEPGKRISLVDRDLPWSLAPGTVVKLKNPRRRIARIDSRDL